MKKINRYIIEKFKINRNTSIHYDPNDLNNNEDILYSEDGDEDERDANWNFCESELERINKNYCGFIVSKFKPISNINNFDTTILDDYSTDLEDLKDKIISGRDSGYEVKLYHGHLEFDCINSGSRSTYYIYALKDTAYADVDAWFEGDVDENDNEIDIKRVLFERGNILAIE